MILDDAEMFNKLYSRIEALEKPEEPEQPTFDKERRTDAGYVIDYLTKYGINGDCVLSGRHPCANPWKGSIEFLGE